MVLGSSRLDASSDVECHTDVRRAALKRRGLSRFYSSKSESFSNIHELLSNPFCCSSLLLAKRPSTDNLQGDWCDRQKHRLGKRLGSSGKRGHRSLPRLTCDGDACTWDGAWPQTSRCSSPAGDDCSMDLDHLQEQPPQKQLLRQQPKVLDPLVPWAEEICSALRLTQLTMASSPLLHPHHVAIPAEMPSQQVAVLD